MHIWIINCTFDYQLNIIMKTLSLALLLFISLTANAQRYLLIGIDSRNPDKEEATNSDMIMIMDVKDKEIKLASIMRDTYVSIPQNGWHKINSAYRLGKAELLMKTLNTNFDLNLKNYIIIDFMNAPKAIDQLNGVKVNVDALERQYINDYLNEQNTGNVKKYPLVTKTGDINLSGGQALAYCRIRFDGDRERTMRQKEVFNSLVKKVSANPDVDKLSEVAKLFKSNMSYANIIFTVGQKVVNKYLRKQMGLSSLSLRPNQKTFPLSYNCKGKTVDGVYYLFVNKERMKASLNNFLK